MRIISYYNLFELLLNTLLILLTSYLYYHNAHPNHIEKLLHILFFTAIILLNSALQLPIVTSSLNFQMTFLQINT